jgi:tetratricopeptide (TPR) repeat protein
MAQSPTLGTHTFVGRERELEDIEALLTDAADVQLRAALDGLPGIGKTELARQVVARLAKRKEFPGGIFWFDAEHADLRLQWAKLAEDAGGPALPDLDARARWAIRQVEQRAQQGDAILIVLDNVETWEPRLGPLPDVSGIRLLVTTRVRWLHNSLRPYEVPPLELGPARRLLEVIVARALPDADELLAALGGHVLSIELAATYLREYGTSPAEYLRQLAAGKSPGSSVADRTTYRATAETAFRLLWKRIADDVKQGWVLAAQLPPAWFSSELAKAIGLDAERRRALVRLHLLDRDGQGRHQMHRLLREFALAEEPPSKLVQEEVIRGATALLETGDEALTFQRYRRDADSFAHLVAAAENVAGGARIRSACAHALRQLGELPAARGLYEQMLASDLKTYGEGHPLVARGRNDLALVLQDLRDLPAARQLFEQALASDLKTFGEGHPDIAIYRNNVARVLRDLGDLPAARQLLEQALASGRKTYGEHHPRVALYRDNLGSVLHALGELPAARQLFEQALASGLKSYGKDHPQVGVYRRNLAAVLRELGDSRAARELLEQTLASLVKTHGEDHPEVADCRHRLAQVLGGRAARELLERTLASLLKTYGEGHPNIPQLRNSLALVLKDLGDPKRARELLEQALASLLQTYREGHHWVATTRNNLAAVLHDLGDLHVARQLFEQALASDLKTYGEGHPHVARDRNNLGELLQDLGNLRGARQLFEQALASDLKTYGERHWKIAMHRANLAIVGDGDNRRDARHAANGEPQKARRWPWRRRR